MPEREVVCEGNLYKLYLDPKDNNRMSIYQLTGGNLLATNSFGPWMFQDQSGQGEIGGYTKANGECLATIQNICRQGFANDPLQDSLF